MATCIAFGVRSTENRRFERALELLKRAAILLSRLVLSVVILISKRVCVSLYAGAGAFSPTLIIAAGLSCLMPSPEAGV